MELSRNALNFSAGPGALPEPVLRAVQEAVIALPETGVSVLGMSHRSDWFNDVLREAEANIRVLLDVPADYEIVFLQGGGSLQFSMIPLSFGSADRPSAYVVSGYWGARAFDEARRLSDAEAVWSGVSGGYSTLPSLAELPLNHSYLHFVSNETVEGVQFPVLSGKLDVPVVCDMSSDFLSRRICVGNYDLIYAHAQKNMGPAGVTVTLLSRKLMERIPEGLPSMLDYRVHVRNKSNYNTPPVFAIYVLLLVMRWMLRDVGGVAEMEAVNLRKAATIYRTLQSFGDAVAIHADPACRSTMNIAFRFRDPELQALFLTEAAANGFSGLEGHRSLGGLRISLYNAMSEAAVDALSGFLTRFMHAPLLDGRPEGR